MDSKSEADCSNPMRWMANGKQYVCLRIPCAFSSKLVSRLGSSLLTVLWEEWICGSVCILLLFSGLLSVHMIWNHLKVQHAALGYVLERRTLWPWFSSTAYCTDHSRLGTFAWVLYSFVSGCLSYQLWVYHL